MAAESERAGNSGTKTSLKNAASLLLKGGVLIKEHCAKCGGVQVKFKDRINCINCGSEQLIAGQSAQTEKPQSQAKTEPKQKSDLGSSRPVLEEKIVSLIDDLRAEKDLAVQKQKTELLEAYLRILEKIASLSR